MTGDHPIGGKVRVGAGGDLVGVLVGGELEPEELAADAEEVVGEGVAAPVVGAQPDDEQAPAGGRVQVGGGLGEGGEAVEAAGWGVEGCGDGGVGVPDADAEAAFAEVADAELGRAVGVADGVGDQLAGQEFRRVGQLGHAVGGEDRPEGGA